MSKSIYHYSSKFTSAEGYKIFRNFENNGRVEIHSEVDKSKNDYQDLLWISCEFAKMGQVVRILPKIHFKDELYKEIFNGLIGTKYDGKCPDLKVGDYFYEHEGFISSNPKTNLSNMLRRGLKQSSRVILDNCGVTERYILNNIIARVKEGHIIDEVWMKIGKGIKLIYKKQKPNSKLPGPVVVESVESPQQRYVIDNQKSNL